jgi:hypothetical protein
MDRFQVGSLTPVFFRDAYSIGLREGGWANIGSLGFFGLLLC